MTSSNSNQVYRVMMPPIANEISLVEIGSALIAVAGNPLSWVLLERLLVVFSGNPIAINNGV